MPLRLAAAPASTAVVGLVSEIAARTRSETSVLRRPRAVTYHWRLVATVPARRAIENRPAPSVVALAHPAETLAAPRGAATASPGCRPPLRPVKRPVRSSRWFARDGSALDRSVSAPRPEAAAEPCRQTAATPIGTAATARQTVSRRRTRAPTDRGNVSPDQVTRGPGRVALPEGLQAERRPGAGEVARIGLAVLAEPGRHPSTAGPVAARRRGRTIPVEEPEIEGVERNLAGDRRGRRRGARAAGDRRSRTPAWPPPSRRSRPPARACRRGGRRAPAARATRAAHSGRPGACRERQAARRFARTGVRGPNRHRR